MGWASTAVSGGIGAFATGTIEGHSVEANVISGGLSALGGGLGDILGGSVGGFIGGAIGGFAGSVLADLYDNHEINWGNALQTATFSAVGGGTFPANRCRTWYGRPRSYYRSNQRWPGVDRR
jgi:hypothetical protein